MNKYAVIGNPIEHSLSPAIFQDFGKQIQKALLYLKIEASSSNFVSVLKRFQKRGGRGMNITSPFKHEAYRISNRYSQEAREAQAVSALRFLNDGTTYGANYDGIGLVKDLTRNQRISLLGKSILILGAGGAARGILGPLANAKPKKIVIANRTVSRARKLVSHFHHYRLQIRMQGIGFNDLKPIPYDIIIHATSSGHQGQVLQLPTAIIGSRTFCYDLSYGKAAAPFLQWSGAQGAEKCCDGLGMLIEHNAALFHLWFGIYPDTSSVLKKLKNSDLSISKILKN
ncbi:shikimate dehydrogenase [Coxiella endosymbiont of Amblyomma sculptum]|uniref:shikimate dehydrogenase n=1 Tax=Coxiella endosymbiont of Amblyomma sculptum TaxID=2487929 RepID=UPI00132EB703|nr:shikimate dehydrogenase [Coxiella endosymbiont of Amblyomma sculptum]QHG92663.1 shikimate dehydrogenase [Coxiella endosymbiont of Amblyomma sculptum]